MIRKFKLAIVPSENIENMMVLLQSLKVFCPPSFCSLYVEMLKTYEQTKKESEKFQERLHLISRCFWIEFRELFEHPHQRAFCDRFPCLEMECDLMDLVTDDACVEPFFELLALLGELRETVHYVIRLQLGARSVSLDEGIADLILVAEENGFISLKDEKEKEKSQKQKRKQKKKPKDPPKQPKGSFGQFDQESFFEKKTKSDKLPESALFLLRYAQQSWPCTFQELQKAYKKAVVKCHPDRNQEDPEAHHTFILVQSGYEELRKRVFLEAQAV